MRVDATAKIQGLDRVTRSNVLDVAATTRMTHYKNINDAAIKTLYDLIKRLKYEPKRVDFQVDEQRGVAAVRHDGRELIRLKAISS